MRRSRRRRCCSCVATGRQSRRALQNDPSRILAMLAKIGTLLPTRDATLGREPCAAAILDAAGIRLCGESRGRDRRRTTSCWSPRPVRECWRSSPSSRARNSSSTNGPRPAPVCLKLLFPGAPLSRFDGAQINDRLDADLRPERRLDEPALFVVALDRGATRRGDLRTYSFALSRASAAERPARRHHRARTFRRLRTPGVAVSSACRRQGRLVFTASLARGFFARHGTSVESRLTVFDKTPAENPAAFREGFGPVADSRRIAVARAARGSAASGAGEERASRRRSPSPFETVASIAFHRSSQLRSLRGSDHARFRSPDVAIAESVCCSRLECRDRIRRTRL